jgi:hypothetical protein
MVSVERKPTSAFKHRSCILLKTSIGRRRPVNIDLKTGIDLAGIRIPDSNLAPEVTELVRHAEPPLLFHHSSRVYYWAALAGKRRGLRFDLELQARCFMTWA